MTPTIGLEVGTQVRRAAYFTRTAPNVLVFGYTVIREDMAADGIAVPADGILLEGGNHYGDARGTAAAARPRGGGGGHRAQGRRRRHAARTGGVCGRTPQVRDALVAKARASGGLLGAFDERLLAGITGRAASRGGDGIADAAARGFRRSGVTRRATR